MAADVRSCYRDGENRRPPGGNSGARTQSSVSSRFQPLRWKALRQFLKNGNISRITTPNGVSQTVEPVGSSSDGARVSALAFVDWDLYLVEKTAVTRIGCATSLLCKGGCKASPIGVSIASPAALTSDDTNRVLYIADLSRVYRFTLGTGVLDTMSSAGTMNGTNLAYQNVNGLGLDANGNLYIGDDPSAGATAGQGHLWMLEAGSAPDVTGGTPAPPAGLTVSAEYAPSVTAPDGPIFYPIPPGRLAADTCGSQIIPKDSAAWIP